MGGDPARALAAYAEALVAEGALSTERVKQAFRRVRRHRFLDCWYRLEASGLQASWHLMKFDRENPDEQSLAAIYSNQSLVTRVNGYLPTTSTSQPSLMSNMLELLELSPGMNVLEIGTGTGYNSALLSEVLGDSAAVYSIELQCDVAEAARRHLEEQGYGGVHVRTGDAYFGFPEGAPYDRIEATVGCSDLSPHWLQQLSSDGFLLVPLQHGHDHPLVRTSAGQEGAGHAVGRLVETSSFMSVEGALAWANPWQSFLLGNLPAEPGWVRTLPDGLPRLHADQPLRHPIHSSLYFFLTLNCRELWKTGEGYGLADPAGATVLITEDGVTGRFADGKAEQADRLFARLVALAETWNQLRRPGLSDYSLTFHPKSELPQLTHELDREWVVERIYFREIVRLPSSSSSPRRTSS